MKELKGSRTEQNLRTAFAGESEARNKYTYFASKAKKDGYVQIAGIFESACLVSLCPVIHKCYVSSNRVLPSSSVGQL